MKSNIDGIITKESAIKYPSSMPGEYIGVWSGYKVWFMDKEQKYSFNVKDGVRGIINCKITITDDDVYVDVLPISI